MWCGKCYRANPSLTFKIARTENELGATWMQEVDKDNFVVSRNGDSLMVTFQCDFCWFINLKKRMPSMDNEHNVLLFWLTLDK